MQAVGRVKALRLFDERVNERPTDRMCLIWYRAGGACGVQRDALFAQAAGCLLFEMWRTHSACYASVYRKPHHTPHTI